ncbi:MAG: ABC transporter ATP-binding protein [Thermoplasmata archaeon]|nr:ABC transporter ATP-binding protein [Thermoplasmata archaeon]
MAGNVLISIEKLNVEFKKDEATVQALKDFSLKVFEGEFVCVLGPSGCGKTTLLRALSGLQQHSGGKLSILPPLNPTAIPVTQVFQDFALFPWRTVRKNIEFPLEIRGILPDQRVAISSQLISLVHLDGFEDAHPKELSGGMKQRVAIARALATEANVLLMDEPFGSLDAQTRNLMQCELLEIWKKTGKTIVFVTHSVDEAVFLADRIVVMTSRPGTVKESIDVDIPRPRDRTSQEFIRIRGKVLAELQEEFEKTVSRERFCEN